MRKQRRQQRHLRHFAAARQSNSQDTSPGAGPPQAKRKKEIELSCSLRRAGWTVVKNDTPGQRELMSPTKQRRYDGTTQLVTSFVGTHLGRILASPAALSST